MEVVVLRVVVRGVALRWCRRWGGSGGCLAAAAAWQRLVVGVWCRWLAEEGMMLSAVKRVAAGDAGWCSGEPAGWRRVTATGKWASGGE
nr:hypothetical protein [Tanacetum cinerariifolium]